MRLFCTFLPLYVTLTVIGAIAFVLSPQRSLAQSPTCATSSGPAAAYTTTVCITSPVADSGLTGVTRIGATVDIEGQNPRVQRVIFYLDERYLLTAFSAPYTFELPTAWWSNGAHVLAVEALLRDGSTTPRLTLPLVFQNQSAKVATTRGSLPSIAPKAPHMPLIVASTGDAADGQSNAAAVVDVIASWQPDLFLYLGDVYEKGSPTEFYNWYGVEGKLFGRFRSVTMPTIGNHEYSYDDEASGYFGYWDNIPSYYSFDAGNWHFISLNTNLLLRGREGSPAQTDWLASDLAATQTPCVLAYFHHPRFSVGPQDDNPELDELWTILAEHGADIVLAGHDHSYQRWLPLDRAGNVSDEGTTSFVAGGGGHGIQAFARSDSRLAAGVDTLPAAYGALRLELNEKGAAYRYENIKGEILDAGVVRCTGASPDTAAPTAPQHLSAELVANGAIRLRWQASQDDTGVAGYTILRNGSELADVDGARDTYVDTTVMQNGLYHYTVAAFDLDGNRSAGSNQVVEARYLLVIPFVRR